MRLLILYPLLCLLFLTSCFNTKIVKNSDKKLEIKSDTIQDMPFEFKNCETSNTCVGLFDCYHTYLKSDQLFDYKTLKESRTYFKLDSLLNCTSYVFVNDTERKQLAEECLYAFYHQIHLRAKIKGQGGIPFGNLHYKIFKEWNSVKSFEICIILLSLNVHDSMGHGDCTNQTIDFLFKIVYPKIKSIYGQDPDQFYLNLTKHLDNEQNYADCFDSVYKIIYPALKKAWEEGKIELKNANSK